MPLAAGTVIGLYRINRPIGRGGVATVYQAHQTALAQMVALKVYAFSGAADPALQEQFRREVATVARLRHPNILALLDHGTHDEGLYVVTDWMEAGSLANRMGIASPVDEVVGILGPIASALDYAHARGSLHRNLKPSNVLFSADGKPLLADFLIAALAPAASSATQRTDSLHALAAMAPEQAFGDTVGPAADQYALAILAYELLTGGMPILPEAPLAILQPRDVNPSLSLELEAALMKGLARRPEDRYGNATDFIAALEVAANAAAPSTAVDAPSPTHESTPFVVPITPNPIVEMAASRGEPTPSTPESPESPLTHLPPVPLLPPVTPAPPILPHASDTVISPPIALDAAGRPAEPMTFVETELPPPIPIASEPPPSVPVPPVLSALTEVTPEPSALTTVTPDAPSTIAVTPGSPATPLVVSPTDRSTSIEPAPSPAGLPAGSRASAPTSGDRHVAWWIGGAAALIVLLALIGFVARSAIGPGASPSIFATPTTAGSAAVVVATVQTIAIPSPIPRATDAPAPTASPIPSLVPSPTVNAVVPSPTSAVTATPSPRPALSAARLVGTIKAGQSLCGVAVDDTGEHVYLADDATGQLLVVDPRSSKVTQTYDVKDWLCGMALDQEAGVIWTPVYHRQANGSFESSQLAGISLGSGAIARVSADHFPIGPTLDPRTHTLYLANTAEPSLAIVNTATGSVADSIQVATQANRIAVSSTTGRLYLAAVETNQFLVVDTATRKVVTQIDVGAQPWGVAAETNSGRVVVSAEGSDRASLIDPQSNKVIRTYKTGSRPHDVTCDSPRHRCFILNSGDRTVTSLDTETTRVVTSSALPGTDPLTGIAVATTTGKVFVVSKQQLLVLDGVAA